MRLGDRELGWRGRVLPSVVALLRGHPSAPVQPLYPRQKGSPIAYACVPPEKRGVFALGEAALSSRAVHAKGKKEDALGAG